MLFPLIFHSIMLCRLPSNYPLDDPWMLDFSALAIVLLLLHLTAVIYTNTTQNTISSQASFCLYILRQFNSFPWCISRANTDANILNTRIHLSCILHRFCLRVKSKKKYNSNKEKVRRISLMVVAMTAAERNILHSNFASAHSVRALTIIRFEVGWYP